MRELIFRGKTEYGEWRVGSLIHQTMFYGSHVDRYHILTGGEFHSDYYDSETVIPETIGQFTGLVDKNGKKIFEGDICKFREWREGDMCWIGRVHYEHQQFLISGGPNPECPSPFTLQMSRFISENIEVIGNIHDNPELLK